MKKRSRVGSRGTNVQRQEYLKMEKEVIPMIMGRSQKEQKTDDIEQRM